MAGYFARAIHVVGLVSTVVLGGCAASPALGAAERGDHVELGRDLAARQAKGDLSRGEAASLARAVAARDLAASSPADAPGVVRDVAPCAHELDGPLASRMKVHDDAGADAALARIGARGLDLDAARMFANDPDPRWRAVGARGLVRSEDREARLRALLDGDPVVRRQAARASQDAADERDLHVLAEAARLDPSPIVRTESVRAIAALPATAETANILRDLYAGPDADLRQDI